MVTLRKVLATVGPGHARHAVTPWCTPVTEYDEFWAGFVWHWMHGAAVGMWFGGLDAAPANVSVLWHTPQSPVVGWLASSVALGRESPAVVLVLGTIPWKLAVSWQLPQVSVDTAGWLMTPGFHVVKLVGEWQLSHGVTCVPIGIWVGVTPIACTPS